MKKFEFSFKNKYVRLWFALLLPVISLLAILIFLVPIEYQGILVILSVIVAFIFYGWVKFDKKKNNIT
ncbi:hypothetical protein M3210_18845 [Oceanobacillus luteolus]|uniref:hypothetical protein n=1 Tax=Oceanobacillus luteolus TaxID=1274358 RepID=UPI00203CEB62|nr:hypothetical protein [Oceanobacillus luteolus]MCM3742293.1 hypothetical protein [Oceanobacillus luteolus]